MTTSFSDAADPVANQLPVWRLIAGLGLLAVLITLLVIAGIVYVDNFRLDRYMRALAGETASIGLSDAELKSDILERARQLGLPVQGADVEVTRTNGRPHIRIARYGVETTIGHMDLRLPEAQSR